MYYWVKVVCDNTTFYYSKLNETFFIVQEAKEMKGLQQVGTVREYRPQIDVKNAIDLIRIQQVGRTASMLLLHLKTGVEYCDEYVCLSVSLLA